MSGGPLGGAAAAAGAVLQPAAGRDPTSWVDVLRHDIAPVSSAFLVLVALLVAFHRAGGRRAAWPIGHRSAGPDGAEGRGPGFGALVRYVLSTAAGGYGAFLLIDLVFYAVLGGEDPSFLADALRGGSVLAFGVVVPAFLLGAVLAERGVIRRGRGSER